VTELEAQLESLTQDNVKQMLYINRLETEIRREAQPLKEE
jgi:hypothetical protein